MSKKRKIQKFNLDEGRIWEAIEGLSPFKTTYTLEEVCEKLNEQDEKINICEIMNQRLSEKSKCDYKKAIIEFCKFMNIYSPLLEVMVDEFLQEVYEYE